MIMGGLVVMFDLDHANPQILHGQKPYTQRSHMLHFCDVACPRLRPAGRGRAPARRR